MSGRVEKEAENGEEGVRDPCGEMVSQLPPKEKIVGSSPTRDVFCAPLRLKIVISSGPMYPPSSSSGVMVAHQTSNLRVAGSSPA